MQKQRTKNSLPKYIHYFNFKNNSNSEDLEEALEVFRKLADHQHELYNSWRDSEYKPLTEINEALHQVRSKETEENVQLTVLFLPSVQYVIPSYQRNYVWSKENWSRLWKTLKEYRT